MKLQVIQFRSNFSNFSILDAILKGKHLNNANNSISAVLGISSTCFRMYAVKT